MKEFIITETQVHNILNTLLEIPAKLSLGAIDIMRNGLQLREVPAPVEKTPVVSEAPIASEPPIVIKKAPKRNRGKKN